MSDGGDGDKKFQKITYLLTDHGDCLIILRLFTYRKVLIYNIRNLLATALLYLSTNHQNLFSRLIFEKFVCHSSLSLCSSEFKRTVLGKMRYLVRVTV